MAVLLLLLPLAGGPAADAHGIVGNSLASIARTAEAAARDAAVGPASRVLMAERNCAACHADLAAAGRIEGPDLALASERLQRGWLEAFLADPLGVHPEGRMPDPWRGQTAEKRAENGEALAEFLTATRRALTPLEAGDARAGARVFHEVGCFACHGAREESELGDAPVAPERAVSLDGLGAKYTGWGLADFLLRPLTHRPGGLMPDLHLSREEAADVAAYLLEGSDAPWESAPVEARPELVVKGRLLWESAGCESCHGLDGPAQAEVPVIDLVPAAALPALPPPTASQAARRTSASTTPSVRPCGRRRPPWTRSSRRGIALPSPSPSAAVRPATRARAWGRGTRGSTAGSPQRSPTSGTRRASLRRSTAWGAS